MLIDERLMVYRHSTIAELVYCLHVNCNSVETVWVSLETFVYMPYKEDSLMNECVYVNRTLSISQTVSYISHTCIVLIPLLFQLYPFCLQCRFNIFLLRNSDLYRSTTDTGCNLYIPRRRTGFMYGNICSVSWLLSSVIPSRSIMYNDRHEPMRVFVFNCFIFNVSNYREWTWFSCGLGWTVTQRV